MFIFVCKNTVLLDALILIISLSIITYFDLWRENSEGYGQYPGPLLGEWIQECWEVHSALQQPGHKNGNFKI